MNERMLRKFGPNKGSAVDLQRHLDSSHEYLEGYELNRELIRAEKGELMCGFNELLRFDRRKKGLAKHIEDIPDDSVLWLLNMKRDMQKSLNRKMSQKIYIAQFGERIKVGTSVEVERRLETHEKKTKETADIIAVFDGDETVENNICGRFKKYLIAGREWFSADPVSKIIREYKLPEEIDLLILGSAWPDQLLLDWYKSYGTHKEHMDARRRLQRIYDD